MNTSVVEKANQVIKTCSAAYVGLIDDDGYPMVSTIAPVDPENIFEVYFVTGIHSNKYKCLQNNKRGSICFHAGGDNITLIGEAEILTDQSSKSSFWKNDFAEFFPNGVSDPTYCVIKFTTRRVIIWMDGKVSTFTLDER
jgi:general stress protein 26